MIHSSETRILARTQNKRRDVRIADTRLIQRIIEFDSGFRIITDAVLDLAPDDPATGRPGQQSVVANMFFLALIPIYGSARKVQTELRVGHRWQHYRRQLELRFPDDDRLRFAPVPNTSSATRQRNRILVPHLGQFQAIARIEAINAAVRCGIGCGAGSLLEPAVNNTVISDGVVLAAASKYATSTTPRGATPTRSSTTAVPTPTPPTTPSVEAPRSTATSS